MKMIALDAMGGDYAPAVTVQGAVQAAKKGVSVGLFGDQAVLIPLLETTDTRWHELPLSLFHCSQTIGMGDEPSRSVVHKKDASLVRAAHALANGQAAALVTAGNSGAALVASTLIVGRTAGVLRPALGHFLPTNTGSVFCLDLGVNADCKPEFLYQFGIMGHVYVRLVKGITHPRVALLSNGSEPHKGSLSVKQAYALLEKSDLTFIGNMEPRDLFQGQADVLVCDGFAGNIMLKAMQGTARAMITWIKQESRTTWWKKLALIASAPLFDGLKAKIDYADSPGALLLGLQQPCIVAHGCSSAQSIERSLVYAHELVVSGFIPRFNQALTGMLPEQIVDDFHVPGPDISHTDQPFPR